MSGEPIRTPTPIRCEITACGSSTVEHVEHPQRGEMVVCQSHAREIEALPEWRFIGADDPPVRGVAQRWRDGAIMDHTREQ